MGRFSIEDGEAMLTGNFDGEAWSMTVAKGGAEALSKVGPQVNPTTSFTSLFAQNK